MRTALLLGESEVCKLIYSGMTIIDGIQLLKHIGLKCDLDNAVTCFIFKYI